MPGAAATSELLVLPTQGTFLPWGGFGHNCRVHLEFWDAFALEGHIIVKICRCKCKMIPLRSHPMAKGTGSSGACSHGSLPERFIPCLHQGPDVEGGLQILCGLSLPISAPPSGTAPFHGQLYAQLCEMQKMLWSAVSLMLPGKQKLERGAPAWYKLFPGLTVRDWKNLLPEDLELK